MLFSKQLLNGSQDFFRFNILIFIFFFKYKTIETHARTFLPLNISAVGSVLSILGVFGKGKCGCPCRDYYVPKCEMTYVQQCYYEHYEQVSSLAKYLDS